MLDRPLSILLPFIGICFLFHVVSSSPTRVQSEELEHQRYMVRQRGISGHSRAGLVFSAKRRQSGSHTDAFFSEPVAIIKDDGGYKAKQNRDALLLLLGKGNTITKTKHGSGEGFI